MKFRNSLRFPILTVAAFVASLPYGAEAAVVWQPAGASTTMQTAATTSAANVIDQSGLSDSYTAGVTDLNAYLASAPTHDFGSLSDVWLSDFAPTGNFDFDLGGTVTLTSMVLWNDATGSPRRINTITLYADDNASFSSPTVIGLFTTNPNNGLASAVSPDIFNFAAVEASYIRMEITANNGNLDTRFGEVAFGVVPEPSAALLAGVGTLFLLKRRRQA